ncbi:Sirt1 protein [Loa loa]|uniref:NAD-dependent protein deacetylase sir-2.1 n=1 Tax=Loa loa TaxID=7209 RepID=A0A1S0UDY9_LOALO|nr:Sirt1 protein [Loa loa]EJD73785.1 Sirt1 protein [Loa loa]
MSNEGEAGRGVIVCYPLQTSVDTIKGDKLKKVVRKSNEAITGKLFTDHFVSYSCIQVVAEMSWEVSYLDNIVYFSAVIAECLQLMKSDSGENIMLDGNMRTETDTHTNSATNPTPIDNFANQIQVNQGFTNLDSGDSPAIDQIGSEGGSARDVVRCLLPHVDLPDNLSEQDLYRIIRKILYSERPRRTKLPEFNSFDDAVELFKRCSRILVLTGAGVSVSCGIPDFRSKNGVYARLHIEYPDLPDPTAMFDINYFSKNPKPFFEFARELFPGRYEASMCHYFIKALEDSGKLLRNYTQNIDTLEQVAGIKRIVQCHGSFATATCRNCGIKVDSEAIREDIDSGADLVVVIGSSLKVQPVALLPYNVNPEVPQILINRESLPHYATDIELLGNCDDIVAQLALVLGPPYVDIFRKGRFKTSCSGPAAGEEIYEKTTLRKAINEIQFKKLLDQPAVKRARLKGIPSMWDARYVSVGSKLPVDGYLFIVPNKNIFPGAEMYYDKDDDIFRQLSEHYHSSPASSSSESGESATNQEEIYCNIGVRTMSLEESSIRAGSESDERSSSCPPRMDLETKHDAENSYAGNKLSVRLKPFLQAIAVPVGEETKHGLVRTSSSNHLVL